VFLRLFGHSGNRNADEQQDGGEEKHVESSFRSGSDYTAELAMVEVSVEGDKAVFAVQG
jgi:hypothetical protein